MATPFKASDVADLANDPTNATGVILHTNLGRAPLSAAARAAVLAASGCVDLEFDLATGSRGKRGTAMLAALAAAVPDAQAVAVVNNNAAALVLAAALPAATGGAQPADDAKYPDWGGQWTVILTPGLPGQRVKFDPTKPWGAGQQAPLTTAYRKVLEDSMADQANGGIGNYPSATCRAGGMPRMMSAGQFEYVVTPTQSRLATSSARSARASSCSAAMPGAHSATPIDADSG